MLTGGLDIFVFGHTSKSTQTKVGLEGRKVGSPTDMEKSTSCTDSLILNVSYNLGKNLSSLIERFEMNR